jgi:hypothetical protein
VAADGAFVVTWMSGRVDPSGVDAREYHRTGAPVGGPFQVNTITSGNQRGPAVGIGADRFVVAWESPDGDGSGIAGQRFRRRGVFADDFENGSLGAWSAP